MKTEFVAGDLSQAQADGPLFAAAIRAMPNLDILVNNAGQHFDIALVSIRRQLPAQCGIL